MDLSSLLWEDSQLRSHAKKPGFLKKLGFSGSLLADKHTGSRSDVNRLACVYYPWAIEVEL